MTYLLQITQVHTTLYTPTGLRHVGCYFVNRFTRSLGLLERLTPDLSDDPTTRTSPIRKCATAAQEYSYRFFAISIGYCISGSNRQSDYQYVRSDACQNGIGAYLSGYFIMDVYEVVNSQTFQDSISAVSTTTAITTNPTTEPTVSPQAAGGSGAAGLSPSWSLGVFLVVTLLAFLTI